MMIKRNTLSRLIVLASALTFLGSGAALAQSAGAYVKGSFEFIDFCACTSGSTLVPQATVGNATFDGAGNVSGSSIQNSGGTVVTKSIGGTYTVTTLAGDFTLLGSGGGSYQGVVSSDGNTIVLSATQQTSDPEVIVGVRRGAGLLGNDSSGTAALVNTTGIKNAAVGYGALYNNTTGQGNNAQGYQALYNNTTGINNSAIGQGALFANTSGIGNNAVGLIALSNMTSGNRNTAIGNNAGLNLTTGSYNTYIGWEAGPSPASSAENYVTRIGVTYVDPSVNVPPTTYIGGIHNSGVTGGLPVYVTASGQLGFAASSERYKTDISSLGSNTDKLSLLRPVSFHVKTDPNGALQYGLIAEEVDKVYPELVIRDDNGKIQGVRYDELAAMLLNEMQKQQLRIEAQEEHARAQDATIKAQAEQLAALNDLKQELSAALLEIRSRDSRVALR
ncbi:MAG: tail fiber domain-containing protein [Steroidobacterales bacterium]